MMKCGRSCIAAFMACAFLLIITAPAYSSYNSVAGQKYNIAHQRLESLRKSKNKMKYRSYWVDCIRTFELVEKKYPKSPSAGDACFDKAGIYQELHQYNKFSKDVGEAIQLYAACQSRYAAHARAPEALYHVIELSLKYKKDNDLAKETYAKLSKSYPDSSWTDKAKTQLGLVVRTVRKKGRQETIIRKMPVPVIAAIGKGQPAGVVHGIRYWSGGAYTRIVIDQDKPLKFQAHELKKPDRLVFDLLDTQLAASVEKDPLPVNDGILKQVRSSQYRPDIVRIVLDLASIKSYYAFPLHDPERLVIDITGEGGKMSVADPSTAVSGSRHNEEFAADASPRAKVEPQNPITTLPSKTHDGKNYADDSLSLSRQLGLKIKTIAIDAGHGGHDPGALGKMGLKEKTITLDIAKRLATLVKEGLGCTVVMTRDKDVFIPLEQRPFIAKSKGADLFVSIHVNASRKRKVRGIETYIQSLRASDRDAMATAARENSMSTKRLSELKSELDRIFADLAKDDKLEESLQLAHAVQGSLVDTMKPIKGHVVNLGVKRAFFYVLINTEMPSILAEVGFISNIEEEKLLKTEEYRQSIAEALYQGVKKYVEARSPQMMGI
ncbi:MAG: N-acetylmuramoyl-L-alanine amidase [Nitrospirae bacterium]|nr:N-acetylmuramoyl-L-alanine amidase [Nitrospirota bacterium]